MASFGNRHAANTAGYNDSLTAQGKAEHDARAYSRDVETAIKNSSGPRAGMLGGADCAPTREGISDILSNALSGMQELNQRLTLDADRVSGPIPSDLCKTERNQESILDLAVQLKVAVSEAHNQLQRLERGL